MDNNELREKWPTLKKRILEKNPDINDEDLEYEIGQEAELLLRLQKKLGKNDKELRNMLSLMG